MSRRVGFGDKSEQPTGARRTGSGPSGVRIIAAIAVAIGAVFWIISGLGGLDGIAETFEQIARGEKPLGDLLAVALPAIFIGAAALLFLLRGSRSSKEDPPTKAAGRATYAEKAAAHARDRDDRTNAAKAARSSSAGGLLETAAQTAKSAASDKTPSGPSSVAGRLFVIGFLSLWLAGWSTGIVFAFGALMAEWGDAPSLFLIVWLTIAVFGWFMAVGFLLKTIGSFFQNERR